jgi:hypothetical protein
VLSLFISSTIRDMHFLRETLANRIEHELGYHIKMSESITFDWTSEDIIKSCLREVMNTDIYVLIVGNRAGAVIPEQGISITRAEYRQAKALRKPIFVLVMNETWVLYEQAEDRLSAGIAEFLSEVSRNFGRHVYKFAGSEEAFDYVRAQLAHLLKSYLEINRSVRDIRELIAKGEAYQAYYRFVLALFQHDGDYNRILSILSQEMKAGDIATQEYVPETVLTLSNVTGATLYKLDRDRQELLLLGYNGDADCHPIYSLNDKGSYISMTYACRQSKLFEKETSFGQKEKIICIPMAGPYVLTLHFLTKWEYSQTYDRRLILDQIYEENKTLLHTLHLYLERIEKIHE